MSYKVTFHTEAYKSHRASKKNWELGTQNDHIKALNGLSFVEETKEELSWRQRDRMTIIHVCPNGCDFE